MTLRKRAAAPVLALLLATAGTTSAEAVIKGTSPSLDRHAVQVVRGGIRCSGVAIARQLVATAAHCGRSGIVRAGGASIAIAGTSKSATLDDGRRVSVSGDALIARLARALPASIVSAPVGEGEGDSFVIAGYGTAAERYRGAFGTLREAKLVAHAPFALVDPQREGSISASACFGDSGGPVFRGTALVGIITRAAHPHPHIACGHLTRWAPLVASGDAAATVAIGTTGDAEADEKPKRVSQRAVARKRDVRAPWMWRWRVETATRADRLR